MLQVAILPVEIACLNSSGEHCPMWPVRRICFFHNSESCVSYCSHVNKSVIPFCGQMFMNTPTHIVLHPLSRRMKGEYSHVLCARRQVSPRAITHSLALSNTNILQPSKLRLKASCKKNVKSSFSCQIHSKEALSTKINHMKIHCSLLLRCCGGLPSGVNSSHKHYARDVTPAMEPFRKMQSAFKEMHKGCAFGCIF